MSFDFHRYKAIVLGWVSEKMAKMSSDIRTAGGLSVGNTQIDPGDGDGYFSENVVVGETVRAAEVLASGLSLNALFTMWINSSDDWTYASATSFTVEGDKTDVYTPGTKIRYKQGGSYEYGYVESSTVTSGVTTVNLIPNDDYSLASAAITDNYYSYSDPSDHPIWLNYTPTVSYAGGTTPVSGESINSAKFMMMLNTAVVKIDCDITRGSGDRTIVDFSAPITAGRDEISGTAHQTVNNAFPLPCAMYTFNSGADLRATPNTMTRDGHVNLSINYFI